MSVESPKDILVVGPPGSGKTALATRFAERNGYAVADLSAILKYIALTPSHVLHKEVDQHIKDGVLVTGDLVKEVLIQEINLIGGKGIVFDGVVRNRQQLEGFNDVMSSEGREYRTALIIASIGSCIQRMFIRGRGDGYEQLVTRSIKDFKRETIPVMTRLAKGDSISLAIERDDDIKDAVNDLERFMSLGKSGHHSTKYLDQLYQQTNTILEYYETAWKQKIRQQMFLKFVRNHGGVNVVDLGCRDGFLTSELAKGKVLTGIDIDSEALRRYGVRYADQKPTTIQQDLNYPIDLADRSQDIVIAGELIEHLVDPDLFVSEVHRILRSGGMFIGSTPNFLRWDKRLEVLKGKPPVEFSDPTHIQHFSQNRILKTLSTQFDQTSIYPFLGDRTINLFTRLRADGFIWRCIK